LPPAPARPNPPAAPSSSAGAGSWRGFIAPRRPHAEIEALRAPEPAPRGADLYVTLERATTTAARRRAPTPSRAGIRRVFSASAIRIRASAAAAPPAARRGARGRSRAAGDRVRERLAPFAKFARTGLPFVTVKIASTLDGRIAARTGKANGISGTGGAGRGAAMRAAHDAILVGARHGSRRRPRLTVRLRPPRLRLAPAAAHHPRPRAPCPAYGASSPAPEGKAWVVRRPRHPLRCGLRSRRPRTLELPPGRSGFVPERHLLAEARVAALDLVLVEGGGGVFTRFLRAGLADRIALFLVPPAGRARRSAAGSACRASPTRPTDPS